MILLGAAFLSTASSLGAQPDGALVYGDDRLAAEALLALAASEYGTRDRISVAAEGGTIVLSGIVPYASDRDAVEAALAGVLGARAISNRIETDASIAWVGPARRDDRSVEADVRSALRASPPSAHVSATVRNGEVFLEGKVGGWRALRETAQAALQVRGVRKLRSLVGVRATRHESGV